MFFSCRERAGSGRVLRAGEPGRSWRGRFRPGIIRRKSDQTRRDRQIQDSTARRTVRRHAENEESAQFRHYDEVVHKPHVPEETYHRPTRRRVRRSRTRLHYIQTVYT